MNKKILIFISLLIISTLFLSGCTSTSKESLLNREGTVDGARVSWNFNFLRRLQEKITSWRKISPPADIQPEQPTDQTELVAFNPGLKIMDFNFHNPITNQEETITAAVWYPTDAEPKPFVYHDAEDYQSKVALDAPISNKGPYPLVLFSHGAFGSGYNAAYFLESLARQGYIAIAPDYIDTKPPQYEEEIAFSRIKTGKTFSNLQVLRAAKGFVDDANADTEFMLSYVEKHRLNHTSFIIDQITAFNRDSSSDFYQAINEEAIGMAGHSLGGLTTLAKTGAYPNKSYTDERIKTALLFSAPAHPFENTVNQIDIPIMFMVGDNDEPNYGPKDVPRRAVYDSAVSPKYLLIIKNSTHFTFGNSGCGETPLYQAVETVPQTNAIVRYGVAFLNKYLKNDLTADGQLNKNSSALAYYIKEETSGQVSEWGKEPTSKTGGSKGGILIEILKRRFK
ncbi:MAG: hypothetical protein ABH896_03835 [Candidatus Jacksonbacteria bacterium]